MHRRFALAFALLAVPVALAGCESCSTKQTPPLNFVAREAEAVLEIRDISVLARAKALAQSRLSAIVPAAQLKSLEDELKLTLGFNPTTPEGLAEAGLPSKGSIAIEVVRGGRGAVWIVPVKDKTKFAAAVQKVAKARAQIDDVKKDKIGTHDATVLGSQFGEEMAIVAVYVFHEGLAIIGVGPNGKTLVEGALSVTPENSVKTHPEFVAQSKLLGKDYELRLISPNGSKALASTVDFVGRRMGRPGMSAQVEGVASAGWVVNFADGAFVADGRVRLTEAGQAQSKKLFTPSGAKVDGIKALDLADAVIKLQLGGDPNIVLDVVAPQGSANRRKIEGFFGQMKESVGTDVEREVLPLVNGHAGVSVGVGDLSRIDIRQLMRNPMLALWTALGIGVKNEKAITDIEKRLDPGLAARNFGVASRNAGGTTVRVVTQKRPDGQPGATLVETFAKSGALFFSNEPAITNKLTTNVAGTDRLGGKGGISLVLDFKRLVAALTALQISQVPPLFRGVVKSALQALGALDTFSLDIREAADGVDVKTRLSLRK